MRYRTIVADPPWAHPDSGGRTQSTAGNWRGKWLGYESKLPYERMTLDAIKALPVVDLAERDAHLYLWTTNGFLRDAYDVVEAWGFRPSTLLTWCKAPMGPVRLGLPHRRPGPRRSRGVKRFPLARRTPLRRCQPLRARPKRRVGFEPGREAWKAQRAGRCAVCGTFTLHLHGHHVLDLQIVRREGGDPWSARNRLDICESCHANQHAASRKIPLGLVPAEAVAFAVALLGEHRAEAFFARRYA